MVGEAGPLAASAGSYFAALQIGIQQLSVCQSFPEKLSMWCLSDVRAGLIGLCGLTLYDFFLLEDQGRPKHWAHAFILANTHFLSSDVSRGEEMSLQKPFSKS